MWFQDQPGVELRNHATGEVTVDKLFKRNASEGPCSGEVCVGSRMVPRQVPSNYKRPKEKILQEAKEFLDGFFRSSKKFASEEHIVRLLEVHKDIENKGTYDLTYDELVYGCGMAWRNAPRCVARVQWQSLKVFDARHVQTAQEMFDSIIEHIKYATNLGRLRSVITVFPPRTDGQLDFRIWNSQLISYAGYRNPDGKIKGDPSNVHFTEACFFASLWDGKKKERTKFDVLPLVIQAKGEVKIFLLPDDIVFQVPLVHPSLPWFEELGLRWYALPVVANMLFDCGGIQFPAAPFNGWYMGTEIGSRDLCDPQRYDISKMVARKLELDTSSHSTLWKDTVLLEVNKAVLYSYQKCGVTIWDHHRASQSFMQFYASEMKSRGGCPADWIWLVPPMSSSSSPLFHQEMALYFLKPSFEYQTPAWSNFKAKSIIKNREHNNSTKKMRAVIIAVRLCSYFFSSRWSKRPKVAILFASQSGRAENFATKAFDKLKYIFQAHLHCMADFDASKLEYQQAIIVVASTFGDGDAPNNGEEFKKNIIKMRQKNSNFRSANDEPPRFAVLGLGSTSYDQFCAFGKFVDTTFQGLGGIRLLPLVCADELNNQEKTFQTWMSDIIFKLCKHFFKEDNNLVNVELSASIHQSNVPNSVRFITLDEGKEDVLRALSHVHHKEVSLARISGKSSIGDSSPDREGPATILLQLSTFNSETIKYKPGDHLVVFPRNNRIMIQRFVLRLKNCPPSKSIIQLQVQGPNKNWEYWKRIPPCSFEILLTRFVDLTGFPSQATLRLLASSAIDQKEKIRLLVLADDMTAYKKWVSSSYPNIVQVLEDFLSVDVDAAALISTLPIIQPRFYSISSSAAVVPTGIQDKAKENLKFSLTVSLVRYKTKDGKNRLFRGLCSSYLEQTNVGDFIICYTKSNPAFHLPVCSSKPLICIAAGSGIAPFRGFWQQRCFEKGIPFRHTLINKLFGNFSRRSVPQATKQYGPLDFYYGCRDKTSQPFRNELDVMMQHKIINKTSFAFSRESGKPKSYVQDLLWKNGARISTQILNEGAYLYICGKTTMATQVEDAVIRIIKQYGEMNNDKAKMIFRNLKVEGRYKTDIFGFK